VPPRKKQRAVVDARSQTQFILDRVEAMAEMGYFRKKPSRDPIGRSPEAVA
jgi:NitT/TauT family transport system substrate-binding protein